MNEITELEQKYLVLKWQDIKNLLSIEDRQELNRLVQNIYIGRKDAGKVITSNYLVLNLEDEISIDYLISKLNRYYEPTLGEYYITRVRNIAVYLVNAILKAKEKV